MNIKLKKIMVRAGVVLVAIIAVGLLVRAVFNMTTGQKLEDSVREMQAEGIVLNLSEFVPECDDQDNAAVLWKAVEALDLPKLEHRHPLKNAYRKLFEGETLTPDEVQKLREIVSQHTQCIQFIREASKKPCFKYNKNWDGEPEEILIPNAIKMIQFIRIFGLNVVLNADEGHVEEAVKECMDGIRFVKTTLQSPLLINYLVNIACTKQLLVSLRTVLSQNEVETALLDEVLKELNVKSWQEGFIRSLESERAFYYNVALRLIDGKLNNEYLRRKSTILDWVLRPVLKSEITHMFEFWKEIIAAAEMPYHKMTDFYEGLQKKVGPKSWHFLTELVPNTASTHLKEATLEAMFFTARIGIACKVYKNKTGFYPDSLEQLIPEYLEKLPMDPFTGKPLQFKKEKVGFIVYSLGSNKRDDNGRGTWEITRMVMEKDDDWSWVEKH